MTRRLREPVPPAPERPLPQVSEPAGAVFTTRAQLVGAGVAAALLLLTFLPAIGRAAEKSTQYHHLLHAGQYLLGVVLGMLLASLPRVFERLGRRATDLGILAVIALPAGMMLAMTPSAYQPIDNRPAMHFLYHVGIAALGVLTGLGAGALGRVTGRVAAFLAVGMAILYAAGVGGG